MYEEFNLFACIYLCTYLVCMYVSVFIGYNARKYASQLPSYSHTFVYTVCVCVFHSYNYVFTTSAYTASKKYS